MRIVFALIIFLFCFDITCNAQENQRNGEVGFTGIIMWNKDQQAEFYGIEGYKFIRPNILIGGQMNSGFLRNKSNSVAYSELSLTAGAKWNLLTNTKRWYFDPSAHLIYFRRYNASGLKLYRGGGFYAGLTGGVKINDFKIGAKLLTHITYGRFHNPDTAPSLEYINTFYHRFFNYGLNLIYTF